MYLNAKEYLEQYAVDETIILEDPQQLSDKWVFNKDLYKAKLMEQLPLPSFFEWCGLTLKGDYQKIETDKFFALTILLFEEGISIELDKEEERQLIHTSNMTLRVPRLKIAKYGIS
jgi:hypothetical protein